MRNTSRRISAILLAFAVAFTLMPAMTGSIEAHAASAPAKVKTLTAKVTGSGSVKLSWSKVKKGISGYAVYRNGKVVKSVGKKTTSFTNTGLKGGTKYKFYVRAYKKSTGKVWYNKKTGKWQKKKPAKKYRGKSKKVTVYTYGKASPKKVVTTKAVAGAYLKVSDAYDLFNAFRTNSANQWYWAEDNKTKVRVTGITAARRDEVLEQVAKSRAKEQWTQYYINGKLTHDRLDGSSAWTAYPSGSNPIGENLAWGQTSSSSVIDSWAEEYENYAGQGHRRNMLEPDAVRVGIACYKRDGCTCWAMCLGY